MAVALVRWITSRSCLRRLDDWARSSLLARGPRFTYAMWFRIECSVTSSVCNQRRKNANTRAVTTKTRTGAKGVPRVRIELTTFRL